MEREAMNRRLPTPLTLILGAVALFLSACSGSPKPDSKGEAAKAKKPAEAGEAMPDTVTPRRLAWRLANPAGTYGVRDRSDLAVISAPTQYPLVRCVGFVGEGLTEPGGPALGASLFLGLEPRLDLASLGFLRLPQRLRPSPLNLIYRPLNAPAPASLDAAQTAVSFLDFDPY